MDSAIKVEYNKLLIRKIKEIEESVIYRGQRPRSRSALLFLSSYDVKSEFNINLFCCSFCYFVFI